MTRGPQGDKDDNDGKKAGKANARGDRLAAALRENLRRRKQQAHGRQQPAPPEREPGAPKRP